MPHPDGPSKQQYWLVGNFRFTPRTARVSPYHFSRLISSKLLNAILLYDGHKRTTKHAGRKRSNFALPREHFCISLSKANIPMPISAGDYAQLSPVISYAPPTPFASVNEAATTITGLSIMVWLIPARIDGAARGRSILVRRYHLLAP